MHLKTYAKMFPDRKPADWARLFGISRTHFIMLCDGRRNPRMALMRTISDKTGGAVPVQSWFDGPPPDAGSDVVDPDEHVEP
jgi:hypothetical protein